MQAGLEALGSQLRVVHAGIVRLARDDAARMPHISAEAEALAAKALSVDGHSSALAEAVAFIAKRCTSVAYLITRDPTMGMGHVLAATLYMCSCIQVRGAWLRSGFRHGPGGGGVQPRRGSAVAAVAVDILWWVMAAHLRARPPDPAAALPHAPSDASLCACANTWTALA